MNMLPIIDSLAAKTAAKVREEPGDYRQDGLLYCGKCRTPKQVRITVCGETRQPYCLCHCAAQRAEKARQADAEAQSRAEIPLMRERCFRRLLAPENGRQDVTVSAAETWTFANDDGDDPETSRMARAYVENWDEMFAHCKGLLLFGGTGGGKTFTAACIANALIDRAVPCYFTSVPEIVGRMKSGDRSEIDSLSRYKLVVLDDLGAERNTEYMSEMVYNVIDARCRSGLPMIVTSNYTSGEIRAAQDMQIKRIFSRLYEMCIPYEIKHPDRRRENLVKEIGHYRELPGIKE